MLVKGSGWSRPIDRNGGSLTTGDALLKPRLHGFCQVHGLSAQMNTRQAVCTLEVPDCVQVVGGIAGLGSPEKAGQLLLYHDGRADNESTLWTRQGVWHWLTASPVWDEW